MISKTLYHNNILVVVLIIIFITTEFYIVLFCIVKTDIIEIVQFLFISLVLSFLNLTLNS